MEIPAETKTIETPSGLHKLVVRSYLTGVERRANRRFIWSLEEDQKASVDTLEQAEDLLLKQIVLSIDGSADDIVDRVLKMQGTDYDFVIDSVNAIAGGVDKKKEVTTDGSTKTSLEESQ